MTVKQKQCLLCYLGYYDGDIDGRWGPRSRGAAEAFQRRFGLEPDGIFGEKTESKILEVIAGGDTGDWWAEIRYFRPEEFACKCGACGGYPVQMEEAAVRAAETVREHFGAPVTVSSGLRCKAHNANVGGVANSRHLLGKAVDFRVAGKTAAQTLAYVRTLPGIRYAYAIDGQFVHMDVP